jgi:cytochrome c oxidase subunit 4
MSTHHEHAATNEPRTYLLTLAALLTLTFITVFAAGLDFGSNTVNVVIALTIATIKATLVALFFMHLIHDKPVNAVILVAGFIFLALFLGFSYTDVSSRVVYDPINHRPPAGGPAAAAEAAKLAGKKPQAATPTPAPAPEHH